MWVRLETNFSSDSINIILVLEINQKLLSPDIFKVIIVQSFIFLEFLFYPRTKMLIMHKILEINGKEFGWLG